MHVIEAQGQCRLVVISPSSVLGPVGRLQGAQGRPVFPQVLKAMPTFLAASILEAGSPSVSKL